MNALFECFLLQDLRIKHRSLTPIDADHHYPRCPYCRTLMEPWPARTPAKHCEVCHQPLMLLPAKLREPPYSANHLCSAGHIALMPVTGVIVAALVFDLGSFYFIAVSMTMLTLLTGALMVWERTANITSRISRLRSNLSHGGKAWRRGVARTLVGLYSMAVGVECLFILVPIAECWAQIVN